MEIPNPEGPMLDPEHGNNQIVSNPEGPMMDPEHGNDQIIWNLNLLEQVLAHPTVDVV